MANVLPEQVLRAYLAQMETGGKASMAALRQACENLSHLTPSFGEADLARDLVRALMERALEDLTRAVPWNDELDEVREQVRKLGRDALDRFVKLHDPKSDHMALLLQIHEGKRQYDSLVEELNETDRQALRNQSRSEQ
jgi:hypothetical protein